MPERAAAPGEAAAPPGDDGALARLATVRGLLVLALPLIAGMGLSAAMQFTDRIFLGRLGTEPLAASVPVAVSTYFFQCLFMATGAYVATFAAQHRGAGEEREAGAMAWPALWISLAGGALCAAVVPALPWLYASMRPDPGVHRDMVVLGSWLLAGSLPTILLATLNAFFAGLGRVRLVLALNCLAFALNAMLSALLVFGLCGLPRLGVTGAGLGTVIATTVTAGLALAIFLSPTWRARFGTWESRAWNGARMTRFLRFALPQGLRSLVEIAVWQFFFFVVGRLGTPSLALSNAVVSWNFLAFFPMLGLSQAIAIGVGQALGAGRPPIARAVAHRGLALELGYALLAALPLLAMPDLLLAVFLERPADPALAGTARALFAVAALWSLGDALHLAYAGALSGAGDTGWQLRAMIAISGGLLLPPLLVIMLAGGDQVRAWGIEPVLAAWVATVLFLFALGAAMAWRFYRGPWRRMSVR